METEEITQSLIIIFKNLTTDVKVSYQLTDNQRRKVMFVVFAACVHFLVLLMGHFAAQASWSAYWWNINHQPPPMYSFYNSMWGLFWVLPLAFAGIMFGGWAVQGPFLGMIILPKHEETDSHGHRHQTNRSEAVARMYVAFVTIELIVNVVFNGLPFFASKYSAMLTVGMLSTAGAYFLLRWLARETIHWAKWAKFMRWIILINVAEILWSYYQLLHPDGAAGSMPSVNFNFDLTTIIGLCIAILVVAWAASKR